MGKIKTRKKDNKKENSSVGTAMVADPNKPLITLTMTEIKNYFDPQDLCTPAELGRFLKVCQMTGLNPFLREAYLIKYAGSPAQIITGYEVYLKRAENSGLWKGEKCWTEGTVEAGNLKACIEIHRKDWERPLYHEVYLKEYARNTAIWKDKPITMLKKVCTAQAYRRAFPEALGGIPYTGDEVFDVPEIQKGKPTVAEPQPLEKETSETKGSENEAKQFPDLEKQIRDVIKAKKLSSLIVRKTLSGEFGREIKAITDLSLVEKEQAIKILGGK